MAQSLVENPILIVRMTAEDRQEINRIIRHKREEFESVIQKGVVAMLNSQEEHDKLADKRAEYLSFMTSRTQRRKDQLTHFSDVSKDATSSAPMGLGTAAQLTLSASNAIGNSILDGIEEKRQATAAEENLYSAQMLYYIPPQDYEIIAERVASILSYRYQLLILRLAAGEKGYIKLANFFLHSMKTYAIARLREQKNNVISALINAAIPPSTDALSYRDWPNIDLANFRTHLFQFGSRKTLDLDENVNDVVKRCGPAVRALLGGYETYIEPERGSLKRYNVYTIIGALNHSPILNTEKRIISGLQTRHRKLISLDGNMKYPMILLGVGETTANLGVNFATITTSQTLEDIHVLALKRLVPDFFMHQVYYKLHVNSSMPGMRYEDLRYPEEKFECPWTTKREHQWQLRLQKMYQAASLEHQKDEVELIDLDSKPPAIEVTAYVFDLEAKKINALQTQLEIIAAIKQIFIHTDISSQPKRHHIYAIDQARYGALAVKEWIVFMLRFRRVTLEELKTVQSIIETANLTINASRGNPLLETERYHKVMTAKIHAQECNDVIAQAHQLAIMNYQVILEMIQETSSAEFANDLLTRESQVTMRMIKHLKSQINDNIRALQKMQDMSVILASYDRKHVGLSISNEDAVVEFAGVVKDIRAPAESGQNVQDVFKLIQDSKQDAVHYYALIISALQSQDCWFNTQDCWTSGVDLTGKSMVDRNAIVKSIIEQLHSSIQKNAEDASSITHSTSWWSMSTAQKLAALSLIKDEAMQNNSKIFAIYTCVSYKNPEHLTDEEHRASAYFLRARQQADFSWLFYLHQDNPEKLQPLLAKAKQLHLSYQQKRAEKAQQITTSIKEKFERLPREVSWIEIKDISKAVRRAKETLELEIRDDVELMDLAYNQILLIHRGSSQLQQEMLDVDAKLQYIQDHFDPAPQNPSANNQYFESLRERLLQLVENISHAGLDEQLHREYLLAEYEKFTAQCDTADPTETRKIGLFFVIQMVNHLNDHFQKKAEIKKLDQHIRKEKDLIFVAINQEPLEYLVARKKSLKALQMAFKHIHCVNDLMRQNQLGIASNQYTRKLSLVANTLNWSSSLSVSEQKWLDKKNACTSKMSLVNAVEYKAPARMAHSFVLALIIEHLGHKRTDLARIQKIQNKLSKIKLCVLSVPSAAQSALLETKIMLSRVSSEILVKIESELDDLTVGRDAVITQSLKIYFNEWKRKSGDLVGEAKLSGFNLKSLDKQKNSRDSEAMVNQYSIDELEDMFISFFEDFTAQDEEKRSSSPVKLSRSSIFNSSPANSSATISESVSVNDSPKSL